VNRCGDRCLSDRVDALCVCVCVLCVYCETSLTIARGTLPLADRVHSVGFAMESVAIAKRRLGGSSCDDAALPSEEAPRSFAMGTIAAIRRRAADPDDTEALTRPLGALLYDPELRTLYAILKDAERVVRIDDRGVVAGFARVPSPWHLALVPAARRSPQQHLMVCTYGGALWVLARDGAARRVRLPLDAPDGRNIFGFGLDSRGRVLVSGGFGGLFVRFTVRCKGATEIERFRRERVQEWEDTEGPTLVADMEKLHHPSFQIPGELAFDDQDGIVVADRTGSRLYGAAALGAGFELLTDQLAQTASVAIVRDPRSGCIFTSSSNTVQVVEPGGATYTLARAPNSAGVAADPPPFRAISGCALEPRHDCVDVALTTAISAVVPLGTWPPGLSGIVERYARRAALSRALWFSDSQELLRVELIASEADPHPSPRTTTPISPPPMAPTSPRSPTLATARVPQR
jgi:hypothetical protein